MMSAGVRGFVGDQSPLVAIEQGNVPLDFYAELRVDTICGASPAVKHFGGNFRTARQFAEKRCVVLNGVARDDGKTKHVVHSTLV